MTNKVKPVPEGFHTVTPYLAVKDGKKALEFYVKAFNAKVGTRLEIGGMIMHSEIEIGDSRIMVSDEFPPHFNSPQTIGGTPVGICLYVKDADVLFNQAVAAGAKVLSKVENQFYGDRTGKIADPFGHEWTIATHIEDMSQEEMQKRSEAFTASFKKREEEAKELFKDKKFAIAGIDDKNEWQKKIDAHGGEVINNVTKNVTHLVATKEEVEKKSSKINSANKNNIPIVSLKFLEDCIEKNKILPVDEYLLSKSEASKDSMDVDADKEKKRKVDTTDDAESNKKTKVTNSKTDKKNGAA